MKFKREIIIISLIIAMLFTVSAVCAANSEVQAISAHNSTDTVVSTANDDNLKMNDANEILAETDDGSFAALNTKISGASGTLTLENNYTWVDSDGSTITDAIEITADDLVIDGNGFTIDAKGHPIFKVTSSGVTIKNINLVNGLSSNQNNGGAITWIGDSGNLLNSYFYNNTVSATKSGGAIYCSDNDQLIIKNCIFVDNAGISAGAIYTETYSQTISNCSFINNTGNTAGAIYVCYAPCLLEKSIFVNNSGYSSAIYWCVYGGGRISNSIFLNNYGQYLIDYYDYYSGQYKVNAYYNWFGSTNSEKPTGINGIIMNNWLYLDMDVNDIDGVATVSLNNLNNGEKYQSYALPEFTFDLSAINATLDKTNVTIGSTGENTVNYDMKQPKGSLTVSSDDVSLTKEIKLIGNFTKLKNDIENSQESVIKLEHNYKYNSNTDSELTNGVEITKSITIDGQGCTIDANGLKNIFYLNDNTKELVLKNIKFVNAVRSEGAAVYAKAKKVTVINCSFIDNDASDSVVFIDSTTQSDIINSIFINNNGLNVKGNDNVVADYNWWGNTAENINADISNVEGVAVTKWYYLDVTFEKDISTISLNKLNDGSSYEGYISPLITLNINSENMTLDADSVTLGEDGKATCSYELTQINGSLTVQYENIEFTKNTSFVDDGSFSALQFLIKVNQDNQVLNLTKDYSYDPSLDSSLTTGIVLTKDIIIDGKGHTLDAKEFVRIFVLNDASKNLVLKNMTFINAKSTRGGAVYSKCTSIEVYDCNFINNTATATPGGAAVEVNGYGSKFVNCTFINNSAPTAKGGAVYITEQGGENDFYDCTFISNYALQNGGAISTNGGRSVINITKCIFAKNSLSSSYTSGIDVYLYGSSSSKIYINNSIFLKKLMTETNYPLYVSYAPNEYCIDNNWWGDTVDTYTQTYTRAGSYTNINTLLYLDIAYENELATISINNLYNKTSGTSAYGGELPQITFNLSGTNIVVDDNLTLDNKGVGDIDYSLTDQTGSLTATYYTVSLTKSLTLEDSFTTLQNKVNRASEGSELVLYHDYNYDGTKDTGLIDGIVIDKDLTIDGQGFTIDAKDAARIFKIDDNSKNIKFKNIKFTNARAADGAAVYANCNNIEIINCTFEANEATNNGDALYVIANGCDITESTFVNNLGTQSTLYLSSNSQDAPFNIDNSILVNNAGANIVKDDNIALTANNNWWGNTVDDTSDLSGGLAQNWYLLDMTVDNTKCIATVSLNNLWDGSAYSACDNYAIPAITANIQTNAYASARKDKVIVDNDGDTVGYIVTDETNVGEITVSYNGVSITREVSYDEDADYSFKALKKIIDAAQDNDTIELQHDYEYVIGYDDIASGIDIIQDNLTINGKGYTINAKGQTRIFNVGDSSSNSASYVTIKNTTFINGKISNNGGAIRWYGDKGNLTNCTFKNNTAANNGGALYWDSSFSNITNCTFEKNSAGTNSGGAIYIQTNNVDIFNLTFQENKASKGGSLYIYSNNITIVKSTFAKTSQGSSGGAIYIALGTRYITKGNNITIINSTFNNNIVTVQGGAIYIAEGNGGENIVIINSSFSNNHADDRGGAIYWADGKNRQIINSTFKNNSANKGGGAIYWSKTQIDSGEIFNSTFIRNYVSTTANSDIYGGAININSGSLTINKTDFIDNYLNGKSNAKGGAIYYSSSDNLDIIDSNFISNGAKSGVGATYDTQKHAYGGAIYFSGGNINITRSTFNRNYLDSRYSNTYGCIIDWESGNGEISNSTFINNHGKTSNNGIFGRGSSNANITNCIFLNNTYGDYNYLKHASITAGTFNFTYCWFGNTPNDNTGDQGIIGNNYLFVYNRLTLDIKHDEYMVVGEDRNVKFVYTYGVQYTENGNINNRDELYDASKLPKINLTLSTENGELNKYTAHIGENLLFKGNEIGSASITGRVYDSSVTRSFDVKCPTKIIVNETFNSFIGDFKPFDASVVCSDGSELPSGVTYSWSYNHNGSNEEIAIYHDGFTGWKSGTYLVTITVGFDSTSDYSNSSTNVTIIVSKIDKEIIVGGPSEITYGNENIDMEVSLDITDETYLDKLTYDSQDPNILTVTNDGLMTAANAGKTNITITYAGSDKYKATSKKVEITVKQAGSDVTVPDKEFVYGSDVIITVTTINSTGDVSAVVLDEDGNVVSGAVVTTAGNDITVTGLNVGNYTLNVTTNDIHNNHYSVTRSGTLNITKAGSDVTVPVSSSLVYGSSVTVVVTGLANATSVTASLFNDTVKVKDLVVNDDVNVVVDASGVDVGTYTLKVTTVTDSNHASVTREGSVVVGQAGSDATVPNSANVGYTESVDVVVSNPVNASGIRAKLYLGDDEVAGVVSVDGLKVTVNALSLNVGEYTLKVTTIPVDDNHASVTHECIVTVNKIDSEVSFIPNEITFAYEDEGSTIATCTGCTIDEENVTILNHPEANIVVDGNKITVSGLDEGEYTMSVITTPDSNYKSIETTLKVTVSGISPKMDMMVSNITVGEKLNVYITMDTEATGIVNITIFQGTEFIQSRNITINNRFNKTEFEGLKVGKYTITAFYYGSHNYNEVTVPDEFTVHPIYAFEFSAEVNDTVCGNTTNATVKLSPDATGSIQIGTAPHSIIGAVTVIELPVQNRAGKNNVTVKYIPDKDSKYGEREIVVYYNVVKKPTEITIADNLGDVKAGGDVTVEVSSYPYAQIVIYLDGIKLDSNTIENISAGTHTIMANVAETSEYLSGTANKTFTVTKTDVEISVSGTAAKVHEKSNITVEITPGVTGTVIVNVNGTDYVLNASDIKPIEVAFDKVGTASLSVKYYGNYKFNGKEAAGKDIVISDKASANIEVSDLPSDIKAGDFFEVTVKADSTVKVYVDGYEHELVNGKLTVSNVAAGPHNITVVAAETPEYYGGEVIKTFEAVKEVATITIADIVNKKAGDDVTVQVSAYDGAVIVVYVDGVERELVDGKVTVSNVATGTHTIVASVDETYEYLSATANKTFEVTKNNVGIFSIVPQTEWDKTNITIQFTDAPDITGYVIMNINGTEYSLNVSDKYLEVITAPGKYVINATYLGNDKYNPANAFNTFEVEEKVTTSIKIEVNPEYNVGEDVTIKVTTNGDNLTVFLNNEKINANYVFKPSKDGIYTIVARTTENATHYAAENFTTFTVTKKAASITVNGIKDVKVGEEITFTVTSEPGNAIVKINNKTIDPTNGKYKFIPQTSGDYTLTVETEEDETYVNGFEIKTFKATKSDISIRISADREVKVGEKATITVVIDADGIVEIDVGGTKYSLNVSDSKSLEVEMNRIGDIQVSAKYLGNERYNACDADPATIKVSEKTTPTIDIEVDPASAVVGDNVNIKVTTNGDNLIVTVLFDGEIKKAATGSLVFTPEKDGAYTIVARTSENATHYAAEKAISFSVINKTKKAPSITVSEIKDARVGEELTFTVESNVAGAVVKINGEVIPPSRGPYRYTPQTGGLHVLTVETPEDGTYSKGLYTQTFDVAKKQSAIQISTQGDLVVDKNIRLIISSYDGAEIAVMMDGKEFNWQNTFKATAGEHLVVASVAENDQYLSNTTSYTFTVAKAKSSISVSGNQVILGQASTITVGLTNGATGMVIVNVGGTEYSINASKSKSLSVVLSKPGTYDISARYLGDEKYLPSESASNTLIVEDKEKTTIDVYTPKDVNAGDNVEIEVVSNNNAIEVYFDGVKQTLKDDKFTVRNIKAGSHEIRVEGPETSELKSNATVSVFNADKQASEVTITLPKTISIGKDIVIEFSSYDGADITAVIDGVKQTLTGGKATLKATAGAHTIVASVDETDKYLASGANKTFNVDKLNSQIAVSGVDIAEGETSKITITTNVNEGIVIVNVADKQVAVDLAKAKSVDIELDTAGTYDLTANYLGTDIYKPSVAAKSTIKVQSKPAAKVDITIPDIKAGESKPISISIPNATGDVHVIVDGVDNVVTLDKDGKASYPLDNIPAGEHNVVVVYDDGVNDPAISSKSFNVSKQTAKAEITTPANVKEGENATVKVNIPGATGEVSVIVDGNEEKIALVNGAAEYQLNNVSGGEHSVVVIYPGDETHDSAYSASSFDVAKKPAVVKKASEFSDITIDDDLMISFILKDEDGNPIRDAVIKYNDGTEKTVKTDYHGQFRIQAVNNALISITYEGNAAITGTGTAFKLNVPAAPVSQKVETHFNIPDRSVTLTGYAVDFIAGEEGIYYSTTLLDANGKPVSNAYMEFAVNNKIYNRTTDAKGSFTPYKLNMIRAGRYTMAFNFAGNENYTNTFACVCVDLDKKPITIKAASKTFKASVKTKKYTVSLSTIVGSSHDGKIYLKSGKPVTLTVNGKKYTAQTNSKNKATFKITGLSKKGTYDATIYFKGDKTYAEKEKTVKLTIS